MTDDIEAARRWFAEDLRASAPIVRNGRVVEAFARVPRERFCGPAPWKVYPRRRGAPAFETPDADPRALYHDVLVVIDEARDLNNGQPSLWAYIFDQLDLEAGEQVLQVGAGTGYYTAVLAEIVGGTGGVEAVELDPELAGRAKAALAPWPQASVVPGNGAEMTGGPSADMVIVFAGATHPARAWLDRLAPGGRLLLPLTGGNGWGFFLLATKTAGGFAARSLGRCGFFPCVGARRPEEARRLDDALEALDGKTVPAKALHLGAPAKDAAGLWFAGEDYWLSAEEVLH
ncbi:protein-L-isoaspartate O-methyltransferase [Pelagibius sp.]|uniref:protein-L-isoaspartate O-methyltransferase family protein n=1 Tax=Pelagibius sp. TaxID=1931238 RepID=UPI00262A37B2|nr:rRNA adenine N-6-methyltransferase family protein [Pelagibius sp.]